MEPAMPHTSMPAASSQATSTSQSLIGSSSSLSARPLPVSNTAIAHTERPKRGRRQSRPDLTDAERKALRTLQNRIAARRSRARSRAKAEELKFLLLGTLQENHLLTAEHDHLRATVAAGNGNLGLLPILVAPSSRVQLTSRTSDGFVTQAHKKNGMSLDAILNVEDEEIAPWAREAAMPHPELDFRRRFGADNTHLSVLTPPSKRFADDVNPCHTSPVSIASPSCSTPAFQKTQLGFP